MLETRRLRASEAVSAIRHRLGRQEARILDVPEVARQDRPVRREGGRHGGRVGPSGEPAQAAHRRHVARGPDVRIVELEDADHVGGPGTDAADAAQDHRPLPLRQAGEAGAEQARRLGGDDRLEGAGLVGRQAAGSQPVHVAGLEQAARAQVRCRGRGLDPSPDRGRGPGGELLVHHLDEQPVGDARMRRRRDDDRPGPREGGLQNRVRARRVQKMRVDGGIEHRRKACWAWMVTRDRPWRCLRSDAASYRSR